MVCSLDAPVAEADTACTNKAIFFDACILVESMLGVWSPYIHRSMCSMVTMFDERKFAFVRRQVFDPSGWHLCTIDTTI